MEIEPVRIGDKEIKFPFTIPAGIVTTVPETIELFAREVPEIGILTTKSIGLKPSLGNVEPIYAQCSSQTFINAVGLANLGYKEFARGLEKIYPLPNGKFLLTSIFGSMAEEFVEIAKGLEHCSDGLELNLSCPHADKGYGKYIGISDKLVETITRAVKNAVDIPVFVKLTAEAKDIGKIAKAGIKGGADGISAINTTVGMLIDPYTGSPVLSHVYGGVSGSRIKPIGLNCVKKIREAVGPTIPIIGMGGIRSARDVMKYHRAGANLYGIGTALTGMNTKHIKEYFHQLVVDLKNETNHAERMVINRMIMQFKPYKITQIKQMDNDLKVFYFDKDIEARPGQFVFTWIPGVAEKPFSIADNEPLTLVVRKVGNFTSRLFGFGIGDKIMIRGPYGYGFPMMKDACLVAGGTGAAPLYFLAKQLKNPTIFVAGKTSKQLVFKEEFKKLGILFVCTEDGSEGKKGLVTELLEKHLRTGARYTCFFNCGPEPMIAKAIDIEKRYIDPERIFASIERYTKCGVGICGSCSLNGYRTCVDGPVFDGNFLIKN
jgi:dihydroorotate dehydrogenase (NAD+) catalytic subunit